METASGERVVLAAGCGVGAFFACVPGEDCYDGRDELIRIASSTRPNRPGSLSNPKLFLKCRCSAYMLAKRHHSWVELKKEVVVRIFKFFQK